MKDSTTKSRIQYQATNYLVILILVAAGIIFVPESYYILPEIEATTFSIKSKNSYFIKMEEGYELYNDGKYIATLSEIDESLKELTVYEEEIDQ